jgi:pseudomonalisin
MNRQRSVLPLCTLSILFGLQIFPLFGQSIPDRITSTIDDQVRVRLMGNVHPLARPEYETGAVPPERRMERMILTLGTEAARESAIDQLVAEQQDPHSARYHRWLTPEEFGKEFGVSEHDLAQIAGWLRSHGLTVEEVARGRRSLEFSGTAEQVEEAFHTQMRVYNVGGEVHDANATDPEIPKALAGVVRGVVALHDFQSKPAHTAVKPGPLPQANATNGQHYVAPADFATIYDLAPLYQNSITGTGQSVAVVARCNIHLSDVQTFRSNFGLPVNNPTIVVNGTDPGIVSNDEETEADLDAEWAGAIAQNATVRFVVSASTNTSDGVMLSAQYIVNNNLAPVMTLSFGLCESAQGAAGNSFINSLWQQAAAEGITVLVAAGDSGAAGCDAPSANTATQGPAVNGLCSTPYDVCVGGTEFNDSSNPSAYWSAQNGTGMASALSYIPETVWNESGGVTGGSQLWAGGGGVSTVYAKPSWQAGPGVPADGMRDVPDVSLTAAGHDGYLIYQNGGLNAVGGTSAATPSFASLMALAVQKTGGRLGNPNPALYSMATSQASGGAAVFHDTTIGNNSVPGVTGFTAGVGYDEASGLGSVDAVQLINNWGGTSSPSLQVSLSSPSISLADGASAGVTVTVGVSGGFSSAVVLSATGLPAGVTAGFSNATLTAPGSGTSTLTLSVGSQVAPGSYPVEVTANGGSVTENAALTLIVTHTGSFTLGLSGSSVSVTQGGAGSVLATVTVAGGFSAAVALTVAGLPTGATAIPTPASFAAPGSGSSTLMLGANAQTAAGSYPVTVTATGGGVTQNASFTLTVTPAGSFALALSVPAMNVAPGASGSVQETVTASGGFNASVTLTVAGLPTGVTATPGYAVLSAPGSGTNMLSLSAGAQTAPGSYPIQVSATGGGITQSATLSLTVTSGRSFTLSGAAGSMTVIQGASATLGLSVGVSGGFSSKVTLSVSGQPSGMTTKLSATSFNTPGSGSSMLTVSTTAQTAAGSYTLSVTATGGGLTSVFPVTVTVAPPAGLTVAASAPASVAQGGTTAVTVTVNGTNNFNATVALSVSGLPGGMTASFSPSILTAPGSGTSTLTLTSGLTVALGTRSITITAKGGGVTQTTGLQVTVTPLPGFTLTESATSASIIQGTSAMITLTVTGAAAFNSTVAMTASGLPSGVTASFSPSSLAAPGSGTSVLTLSASPSAPVGNHTITITAKGGNVTESVTILLSVTLPPSFTLSESVTSATVARGSSTAVGITLTETGGFNAPVTLTVSGMPSGVTVSFSPVTTSGPGVYKLTVNLAAASTTAVGSSTVILAATGGGITHAVTYALKVK